MCVAGVVVGLVRRERVVMVGACVADSADILLRGLGGVVVNDAATVAIWVDIRVLGATLAIILDHRFDVGAEFGPSLGGMVCLAVAVGHAAVTLVLEVREGYDYDVFDCIVGGFAVLVGAGGVEGFPCSFVGEIGGEVRLESGEGRVDGGSWKRWSEWYWL